MNIMYEIICVIMQFLAWNWCCMDPIVCVRCIFKM